MNLTSIMIDSDATIAAKAVAELVASKLEMDKAEAEAKRPNPFMRARAAIADFQERVTGGEWPSYANRAAVRQIAKAANAPADIVRFILRCPQSNLGRPK